MPFNERDLRIRGLIDRINLRLSESGGIHTTEIDELYDQAYELLAAGMEIQEECNSSSLELLSETPSQDEIDCEILELLEIKWAELQKVARTRCLLDHESEAQSEIIRFMKIIQSERATED